MPEKTDAVAQLRTAAQRREEFARLYRQKAERYREEAKEMRRVAGQIARAQAPTERDAGRGSEEERR